MAQDIAQAPAGAPGQAPGAPAGAPGQASGMQTAGPAAAPGTGGAPDPSGPAGVTDTADSSGAPEDATNLDDATLMDADDGTLADTDDATLADTDGEPASLDSGSPTPKPKPTPQNVAARMAEAMLKSGEILLRSGCQVRTVEDTMVELGNSFSESTSCSSYVTLTGIIVGVATPTSEATKIARVDDVGHDLWAIGQTVALAHACTKNPQTPEEVLHRLEAIENGPVHKPATLVLANAVCTLGCCLFYGTTGPTWAVILCAAVAGVVVYFAGQAAGALLPNSYAVILVQSLAATASCVVFHRFVPAADLGSTLIPVLMLLVPGMTFTTALQDTLSGNYLSGSARLSVALLVGVAIAIGSAVVLYYTGVLTWRP